MKKILVLLLAALMLAGCRSQTPAIDDTSGLTMWEQARSWDEAGVLTDLPLTVSEGWRYANSVEFQGDLLLWSLDAHLENHFKLSLCLVELDDGSVTAQADIDVGGYLTPQVLERNIFLCDNTGGQVIQLDSKLQVKRQWQVEPEEGYWFMGAGETLYRYTSDQALETVDLTSGETTTMIDSTYAVSTDGAPGALIHTEYYDPDTGELNMALLDLSSGELEKPPFGGKFSTVDRAGDTWLCNLYDESWVYYLGSGDGVQRTVREDSSLRLLEEGYILESSYDCQYLRLYALDGGFVSGCELSWNGEYYPQQDLIWNEKRGGYYIHACSYSSGSRLLFWDLSKGTQGEDLTLEEVPGESEEVRLLRQRADELSETYGLKIWIGSECQTEFDSFTAAPVTGYERVTAALDRLESALAAYPEGFFRQLRYDTIQGVQIHLVGGLTATDERAGGTYAAFTQPQPDHYMLVADVFRSGETTYYHELSHIIDAFLDWDAANREDALYSEEEWMQRNPADFEYVYSYGAEPRYNDYPQYFVDTYSMVSPTEDRARVLEYAMSEGCEWMFDDYPELKEKLRYYCQCIRDAFDTQDWPQTTLWEQYL